MPVAVSLQMTAAFYLDDPSDRASEHLLREAGVVLSAGGCGLVPAIFVPATDERAFRTTAGYAVRGGGCLLDVRDSADAWVRIALSAGDVVLLDAGVRHRLPAAGTPAVVMPQWPADVDRDSRMSTATFQHPADDVTQWGEATLLRPSEYDAVGGPDLPDARRPQNTRAVVVDLCESFYGLGWVGGTGGGVSVRHGGRIFMAPSGVQKERLQTQDLFVLDSAGGMLAAAARQAAPEAQSVRAALPARLLAAWSGRVHPHARHLGGHVHATAERGRVLHHTSGDDQRRRGARLPRHSDRAYH